MLETLAKLAFPAVVFLFLALMIWISIEESRPVIDEDVQGRELD